MLSATGSLSGVAYLEASGSAAAVTGFAGLTVQLQTVSSQGVLRNVPGVSPVQTVANGSYSFNGLAAGTYQIQVLPAANVEVEGLSPGTAGGTVGSDEIQVTLAPGQNAADYNFAILGTQNDISLRSFMASAADATAVGATSAAATVENSPMDSIAVQADVSGPTVTVNALTTNASGPTLTGTVTDDSLGSGIQGVAVSVGGESLAAVVNGSNWSATVSPGLVDGSYTIQATATDNDSNIGAPATGALVIDTVPPVVTVNPLATTDTTPTLTGTVTDASPSSGIASVTVTVDSQNLTATVNGTSWTAVVGTALSDGTYDVVATATDNAGNSTSITGTGDLVVGTVPAITTQPTASTLVEAGGTVSLTAAASGSPTATVQWQLSTDGGTTFSNISGATSTSYSFTASGTQNGDEYQAVFTNSVGAATTNAATLTVDYVTTQPASQTLDAGATVTLTAATSNGSGDAVQWYSSTDGGTTFNPISGATATSYSFTAAATQNLEEYEAVFTNSAGTVTSNAATLTVDYAPTVTTNPTVPTLVDPGNTVTLTAAATGNPTATVQWQMSTDGGTTFNNITGATSTTYSFTAAASQSGNEYEAVFTNSVNSATTTAATLTVDSVTTQPATQTIDAGATVTLTAATSNGSGDTVQWNASPDGGTTFNPISGATSTSYSFTAAATQNLEEYEAVFTNSAGTVTSNAATLTVDYAPTVTTNPTVPTLVDPGNTVTLTAAATGNPTATVQWQMSTDGGTTFNNITGATSTTYSFTAAASQSGNEYEAVFTNSVNSATTTAVTLTVDSVTTQPATQTVDVGATVTLTAATSNGSGDAVQWYSSTDGGTTFNPISGATATSYSFTAAASQSGNEYEAVFTNSPGTVTSNAATLTVAPASTVTTSPIVTTNPTVPTIVDVGNTVTLTAAASGDPAPTVQWKVSTDGGTNFSNISGATSTTYSFTAAASQSGNEYEAVFTNSVNSATTTAATLTVDSVTTQPATQTVDAGATVTLTAASTDGSSDTVQWKASTNGGTTFTAISGATATTYSFTAASTQNSDEYEAVFTNSAGTLTSNAATLTVDSAPTVTTNPTVPTIVDVGNTVTLTAAATGNPAATVQWKVSADGGTTFSDISGATSTTYSFTAAASQSGNEYEAVFTNSVNSATTTAAKLTVDSVTTQPASQTVNAGASVTLTAASTDGSSDTVQWKVSTERRHDLHGGFRRDLDHLQLHGHFHAKQRRVRGGVHQLRRHAHQQRRPP